MIDKRHFSAHLKNSILINFRTQVKLVNCNQCTLETVKKTINTRFELTLTVL